MSLCSFAQRSYSFPADVYSLGVCFRELISLKRIEDCKSRAQESPIDHSVSLPSNQTDFSLSYTLSLGYLQASNILFAKVILHMAFSSLSPCPLLSRLLQSRAFLLS